MVPCSERLLAGFGQALLRDMWRCLSRRPFLLFLLLEVLWLCGTTDATPLSLRQSAWAGWIMWYLADEALMPVWPQAL